MSPSSVRLARRPAAYIDSIGDSQSTVVRRGHKRIGLRHLHDYSAPVCKRAAGRAFPGAFRRAFVTDSEERMRIDNRASGSRREGRDDGREWTGEQLALGDGERAKARDEE